MMLASALAPQYSLDRGSKACHFLQPSVATEPMSQDRQQMWAKPFYLKALRLPLSVPSIATTDRRAQGRCGEVCCATPPEPVRCRRDATVRWLACAWSADQPPARAPLPMRRRRNSPARPWRGSLDNRRGCKSADTKCRAALPSARPRRRSADRREYWPDRKPIRRSDTFRLRARPPPPDLRRRGKMRRSFLASSVRRQVQPVQDVATRTSASARSQRFYRAPTDRTFDKRPADSCAPADRLTPCQPNRCERSPAHRRNRAGARADFRA